MKTWLVLLCLAFGAMAAPSAAPAPTGAPTGAPSAAPEATTTGVPTGAPSAAPKETVTVDSLSTYPGYTGTLVTIGTVDLEFVGTDATIKYDLTGADGTCTTPSNSSNSCGIHVHEGATCAVADDVGGHYYAQTDDPWKTITFTAAADGTAKGEVKVDFGKTLDETKGRALVIHDKDGKRVACAVIPGGAAKTTEAPTPAPKAPKVLVVPIRGNRAKYPGYNGTLVVEGGVMLSFQGTKATIQYNLTGVEKECETADENAANSCGVHVHAGESCDTADGVKGHYWDDANGAEDPWGTVVYKSLETNAVGATVVDFGKTWDQTRNRALVIHDRTGARVACAVIPPYKEDECQCSTTDPKNILCTNILSNFCVQLGLNASHTDSKYDLTANFSKACGACAVENPEANSNCTMAAFSLLGGLIEQATPRCTPTDAPTPAPATVPTPPTPEPTNKNDVSGASALTTTGSFAIVLLSLLVKHWAWN